MSAATAPNQPIPTAAETDPQTRLDAGLSATALRAVTSTDGMTADFYAFEMKFLGETATTSA